MLFNGSLNYVVNRIKYVLDKMIILLQSMYERNEYSTMLRKERNELMHTGNKENT